MSDTLLESMEPEVMEPEVIETPEIESGTDPVFPVPEDIDLATSVANVFISRYAPVPVEVME